MLLELEGLFEQGLDFGAALRAANIKSADGIKVARVYWGILERIAEFDTEKEDARSFKSEVGA
jgi:hypothetical protein